MLETATDKNSALPNVLFRNYPLRILSWNY